MAACFRSLKKPKAVLPHIVKQDERYQCGGHKCRACTGFALKEKSIIHRLASYQCSLIFLTVLTLSASLALAEPRDCDDPLISADVDSDEMAETVCDAALRAKTLLGSCGLTQTYPINIAVVERAVLPGFGECLAVFDTKIGCLQVTEPGRLPSLLRSDDARSLLPPDIVFAGLITHELSHALVEQSAGQVKIGPAEQEFIANAFEMESLDPKWRDILLAENPVNPPGSEKRVNLGIYAIAPRVFANNAWQLFHHEGVGCSLVQKIVQGEYKFPRN